MRRANMVLVAMVLVVFMVGTACVRDESVKIYYIPADVQTYLPVTASNIEKRAMYRFEVPAKSELVTELISQLESDAKGSFDRKLVRIKVETASNVYLVDSTGGVRRRTETAKSDMADLERVLNRMITRYRFRPDR